MENTMRCRTMELLKSSTHSLPIPHAYSIHIRYWLLRWKVRRNLEKKSFIWRWKKKKDQNKSLSILENRSNVLSSKDVHLIIIIFCLLWIWLFSRTPYCRPFCFLFRSSRCFAIVSGIQFELALTGNGQMPYTYSIFNVFNVMYSKRWIE